MGQFFDHEHYSKEEFAEFNKRLELQLSQLKELIEDGLPNEGPISLGAELEMYLVDKHFVPQPINHALLTKLDNPQLTEELNRYNLEFNLSPVLANGTPFSDMADEMTNMLDQLQSQADKMNSQILPIGILPTLDMSHLTSEFMTNLPRYRVLTKELTSLRGGPFKIDINGEESVNTESKDLTLEGANTSFQLHLKVPSEKFKKMFNSAQLITPLITAVSANSPIFLGKKLWQETRIALFKQSIDCRMRTDAEWKKPARVSFGLGWVRDNIWELFAENVNLYPPIIPKLTDEPFSELLTHQGTIWNWNRAIFDPGNGNDPHLRIEFRSLPAGPTVVDMMANSALAVGLTVGLSDDIDNLLTKLPFRYAEYNFYRAAELGLDANLIWPTQGQHSPTEQTIGAIILSLLPTAKRGLQQLQVDDEEIDKLLTIIRERVLSKQNGATWQLLCLEKYERKHDRKHALELMLKKYLKNLIKGKPVAKWKV